MERQKSINPYQEEATEQDADDEVILRFQDELLMHPQEDMVIQADEADLLWKISARLQAEAQQRLETRSKTLAEKQSSNSVKSRGFTLEEVKAIANDAGIGSEFVELALKEIETQKSISNPISDEKEQRAAKFLDTKEQSFQVSKIINDSPEAVINAMQRLFPHDPYNLKLIEVIGDQQNIKDAVLVFEVPQVDASGMSSQLPETQGGSLNQFSYNMSIADLNRVVVSLHQVRENPQATEISLHVDMRHGKWRNFKFGAGFTAFMAVFAGILTGFVIGKTNGLMGSLLGGVVSSILTGAMSYFGYRWAYKWGLKKGEKALQDMLNELETHVRTKGLFSRH